MLTKSEALAEDLVQDVFVQVWLKRAELPKIGQFGDWLFIVARNRVLNELQKRSREAPFTESLLEYFQDQRRTPEQIFLQREAGRLIHESIERLAPQQQAVYRMSREQGMSHEAIADALGISKNTVHNHLTQALRNMRAYLESHSDGLLLWISVITAWLS